MACHELAALRLGMMSVLGIDDESARQHELAELGNGADNPGPLRALVEARDLRALKNHFESALADLDERVASSPADSDELHYLRTLMVLTRKVDLDLENQMAVMDRIWQDLDEMHDYVHELFPARTAS